jgi:hypothetical protein
MAVPDALRDALADRYTLSRPGRWSAERLFYTGFAVAIAAAVVARPRPSSTSTAPSSPCGSCC